ncbi:MAG TPA: choice-of-anchor J domain-containing protein [Pyrinomonadaceae bacterium]
MAVISVAIFGFANIAKAQAINEDFANITTLSAAGWFFQNNSTPTGTTGWFQGNSAVFPAQAGAVTSYIGANFNSTTGDNTISNWLLTPNRTFNNGDVVKFWTRTTTDSPFPDRLEVRLSTNGASTNVGTGSTAVGDFTTLLTSINPGLTVGGYPDVWTEFTITLAGLPAGGASGRIAFRYFVTNGGPAGDNSNYIGIDTFSYTPGTIVAPTDVEAPLDYNGDNKTDYVVVRNTGGGSGGQVTWFINNGTTSTQTPWGISTDFFVSGDFDGDDKHDITVYRPTSAPNSFFYALRSTNATLVARELGATGDDPTVVGDYDGDDIDDFAVYRSGASAGQPSFWYYRGSATANGGITFVQFGQNGDFPSPGDYDGDGKNDYCVQRNNGSGQGVFLLNKSTGGSEAVLWGTSSDLILPGDYDGDGKDDFAVARGSGGQIIWSVLGRNANNVIHYGQPWGLSATDFPTQGDYDGDGKTDIAVWRPNADVQQNFFYIRQSSNSALRSFEWGQQGDYPVANYNSH